MECVDRGRGRPRSQPRRGGRLADAVAGWGGIATGLGSPHYGAQVVVEAEDRASALQRATEVFVRAAERAGLPSWPVTEAEAISEVDDFQ